MLFKVGIAPHQTDATLLILVSRRSFPFSLKVHNSCLDIAPQVFENFGVFSNTVWWYMVIHRLTHDRDQSFQRLIKKDQRIDSPAYLPIVNNVCIDVFCVHHQHGKEKPLEHCRSILLKILLFGQNIPSSWTSFFPISRKKRIVPRYAETLFYLIIE